MKYLFTLFTACLLSLNLSAQIESGTLIHAQKLTYYTFNSYTEEHEEVGDEWVSCYLYFEEDFCQLTIEGEQEKLYWNYEFSDEDGNDFYTTEKGGIAYINYEENEVQFERTWNDAYEIFEELLIFSAIELVE